MYGSRLFIYKNATLSEFDKVALIEFNIKKKCRPVRVLLNTRCDLSYLTNAFEEESKTFRITVLKYGPAGTMWFALFSLPYPECPAACCRSIVSDAHCRFAGTRVRIKETKESKN